MKLRLTRIATERLLNGGLGTCNRIENEVVEMIKKAELAGCEEVP